MFETVEEGIIWTQIVQKCAELGNTHCPKAFDEVACMTTPFYKNEYEKPRAAPPRRTGTTGHRCGPR